jgi:molecular chaperone DnaK (HSP70)
VEILATGGDRYLGGDEFDKLLVSYLKKKHGGDGWVAFAKGARVHLSNSKVRSDEERSDDLIKHSEMTNNLLLVASLTAEVRKDRRLTSI